MILRAAGAFSGDVEVILEKDFSYEAYIVLVRYIYGDKVFLKGTVRLRANFKTRHVFRMLNLNLKIQKLKKSCFFGSRIQTDAWTDFQSVNASEPIF